MCRCKYPKYINKQGISVVEDEKGERCYKAVFDLNCEGNCILVISRAPKEIGKNKCDCLSPSQKQVLWDSTCGQQRINS